MLVVSDCQRRYWHCYKEIVVSLKTTSKDRMGKIFLDKLLMQKFAGHSVKVIGIFLNDVQIKNKTD